MLKNLKIDTPPLGPPELYVALRTCCEATIKEHVLHNEMMLCRVCHHIIKCFASESAFRNYLKFCQSRKRSVLTSRAKQHYVVVFEGFAAK